MYHSRPLQQLSVDRSIDRARSTTVERGKLEHSSLIDRSNDRPPSITVDYARFFSVFHAKNVAFNWYKYCVNCRQNNITQFSPLQTSQPWSTENLELEAQNSGDFSKNLEIDYYLYFWGLRKNRLPFFGVEHNKNTIRVSVSISSKSATLICTKMSRGRGLVLKDCTDS